MLGLLLFVFIALIAYLVYGVEGDNSPSIATSLGIAFGVETGVIFFLGCMELLFDSLILLGNIILITLLLLWRRPFKVSLPRYHFEHKLWLLLVLVFVVLSFYSASLPRKGFDAHKYHFYYGKIIAIDGRIPAWGEVYDHHWYFPQMYELLLAGAWSLSPDSYLPAYILNAFIGVVCGLVVYETARGVFGGGRRQGIMAVLILYSTPLIFTHMTNGYNDLLLGTFTSLGLLNMLNKRSLSSGLMFGLGLWVKVFGLINIGFLLILFIRRRNHRLGKTLLVACLIGSLFFVRNTVVFGDPLSIYAEENAGLSTSSLWGSWSSERILDSIGWWFLDYAAEEDFLSLTHRGIGILLPVFIIYAFISKVKRSKTLFLLALIWVTASMIYCNLGGEGNPKQIARYAMPGFIPLCVFAGLGLSNFLSLESSPSRHRIRIALILLLMLFPSLSYALIPGLDAVSLTGSPLPSEDDYFSLEYPETTGLWHYLPEEPYSVKVAWIGLGVTPYVLRQRRAEWPRMWQVEMDGVKQAEMDYLLVSLDQEAPEGLDLQMVFSSKHLRLFRVVQVAD